jgi:hypothetical protein
LISQSRGLGDVYKRQPEYKAKFTMDSPKQEAFNLDKVEEDSNPLPF